MLLKDLTVNYMEKAGFKSLLEMTLEDIVKDVKSGKVKDISLKDFGKGTCEITKNLIKYEAEYVDQYLITHFKDGTSMERAQRRNILSKKRIGFLTPFEAKVFISGSLSIKRLPREAEETLRNIMSYGYDIIIGDAPGLDSIVQEFLFMHDYNKITVYCMGQPRNNIGNWAYISVPEKAGIPFFVNKDIVMTDECSYALAIWDGKSKGTKANIDRLEAQEKYVKVIRR